MQTSGADKTEKPIANRPFRARSVETTKEPNKQPQNENFLWICPAIPTPTERRTTYKRSNTTLTPSGAIKPPDVCYKDAVTFETDQNGSVTVVRTSKQKELEEDRISLDRRGLNNFPVLNGETRLRLLSLQHNLIDSLDRLRGQCFPFLVFLDLYDNRLERIVNLDCVENLRVILIGKNRLKKIDGFQNLKQLEVLDLHGNKITHLSGLSSLSKLKVLNLAGNQLRTVGALDLTGLTSLQELNLRRNRLRKLLGFDETPCLVKLFLSNNELKRIEDVSSVAKSPSIKEICIESNPVAQAGDCASFLVSYLPNLNRFNSMVINEQVRKAATAWRRNKETTNAAFMDLTSDVCLNVKRDEVISNARTNWELLRSQSRSFSAKTSGVPRSVKNIRPDSEFFLTPLRKTESKGRARVNGKNLKVPILPDKRLTFKRSSSQDTENSQTTISSSNTSSGDLIRLPPLLVPLISKLEQEKCLTTSGSSSSPIEQADKFFSYDSDSSNSSKESGNESDKVNTGSSNVSTLSSVALRGSKAGTRNVKSAYPREAAQNAKHKMRASTAKNKTPPEVNKDREQGGDYLIEICGRFLNIFGQGALRFIDKRWNDAKANDITTVKFNYLNFNSIVGVLHKLKIRFPNIESFVFRETNVHCLGQLNALAEAQGLSSLSIEEDGNPIYPKKWRSYAIFRLSHWGLKTINGIEVTKSEIEEAEIEFQGLKELVLLSLPDVHLQPLLSRLRIDLKDPETNAKKWLRSANPELKSVVGKEALQWKKGSISQEDLALRQRARASISSLLTETENTVHKLRLLDQQWPSILHEIVCNTLIDYSHMELYMKRKLQELTNN